MNTLTNVIARICRGLRAVDTRVATVLGSSRMMTGRAGLTFSAVIALGAGLMIYRLGAADVCERNEAVEAVFVQQIVDHDEWMFPRLNADEPMYKPPLFHWTAALLAAGLGLDRATATVVRLPSAFYGLLGVLLTMLVMLRWLGLHGALLSGLVLLGSYQYMSAARFGRVDMTLTFCETLALFGFAGWQTGTSQTSGCKQYLFWPYLCALGLGLAVLAKGPVGIFIPLLTMVVWLKVDGSLRSTLAQLSPGPVILLIALSTSWYALCFAGGHTDVLQRQLGGENTARAVGGLGAMPSWYYVRPVLFSSLPLSLLVPVAVVAALRHPRTPPVCRRPWQVLPRLFAIFWALTLLVFSLVAYKRRAYLLPLCPAAAVTLTWWLCSARLSYRALWRGGVTVVAIGMVLFNALYLPYADVRYCNGTPAGGAAADIKRIVPAGSPLYWFGTGTVPPQILFYLDRAIPRLPVALDAAPPGFVLVRDELWQSGDVSTLLRRVTTVGAPPNALTLLYRPPS